MTYEVYCTDKTCYKSNDVSVYAFVLHREYEIVQDINRLCFVCMM